MELSGTFHPALRAPLKEGNSQTGNLIQENGPNIEYPPHPSGTSIAKEAWKTPFRELLEKIDQIE